MLAYVTFCSCHAAMTLAVFLIARALFRFVSRGSESRRLHGRYVLSWSVGAYAAGPPLMLVAMSEDGQFRGGVPEALPASYAIGMLSLLVGWFIGTIHGGIMLAWRWFLLRGRRGHSTNQT